MIIDLHCHTKYSEDNDLEPEDLIRRAVECGLDGLCLTEHHSMECSRPALRLKVPDGFLLLRGVEVSTDAGHLLVYGVEDDTWNRWGASHYPQLAKVMESVHSLGGVCVPAHPFRGWRSIGEKVFSVAGFDGIETHNGTNGSHQNEPAILAALKLELPSIGGSDCHHLDRVGRAFTEFLHPIHGMHDLVREIKAGNCRGAFP